MKKNLTKCEIVAFKTVFPETKRVGIMPGKSSEAYKAIKEIRGAATTKEDMQPWLNAPVLAFYNEAGGISHVVYRATCVTNNVECFWQPELCLLPVEAYYAGDCGAMEKCRSACIDNAVGVSILVDILAENGITVDLVTFRENLKKLKTEKIFNNRWSTLCCQNIELLKTGWHKGSYFDMFIEVLLATKDLNESLFEGSVAIRNRETEETEWFYLIPSLEVRCALSEVPVSRCELLQFGFASGLCLESPEGTPYFTNADGDKFYAFSVEYINDYRKCFKAHPEYVDYVFTSCESDDSELEDEDLATKSKE